jgi:hypothetical protein
MFFQPLVNPNNALSIFVKKISMDELTLKEKLKAMCGPFLFFFLMRQVLSLACQTQQCLPSLKKKLF